VRRRQLEAAWGAVTGGAVPELGWRGPRRQAVLAAGKALRQPRAARQCCKRVTRARPLARAAPSPGPKPFHSAMFKKFLLLSVDDDPVNKAVVQSLLNGTGAWLWTLGCDVR
jgi:hypothetical protein